MLAIARRTRELAIRVALGARETSIRWMVLTQGMRLMAAGALLGLAATVPLMRLLASQLYGIAPHDITTLGVSLIGLLLTGGLACDVPARRAAHLDTASALRRE
ncbi:MAG: FtsX-like permease family protein [Acidobacteria bacterium]|nr:FtsX-like permease family protein [Acidobacteriota bacterium]MYD69635.1 FtsX-like permease family protein [Acidobacteriota bacterium]MYJ03505.1 FtsX-like permease family protein [Acidobacteriota bacterium]